MGTPSAEPWYRFPIVWLVAAIVAAVLAACIGTILLAIDHADTPLDVEVDRVLNVPATRAGTENIDTPAGAAAPQ